MDQGITILKNEQFFFKNMNSWAEIHTAEDLGRAIVYKLTRCIVDDTYKDATSFGYKVKRDGFKLSFTHPQNLV